MNAVYIHVEFALNREVRKKYRQGPVIRTDTACLWVCSILLFLPGLQVPEYRLETVRSK